MLFRSGSRGSTPSSSPSPPSSPSWKPTVLGVGGIANIFLKMRRARPQEKGHHIESTSGALQSHPGVVPEPEASKLGPFKNTDTFVCIGGVNAITLLRATRTGVVEEAEYWGANALVDEQWTCTICGPKNRSNGTFRVQICYTASAIYSTRPDPHKPVALDQAKGVPGLMTIVKRNND